MYPDFEGQVYQKSENYQTVLEVTKLTYKWTIRNFRVIETYYPDLFSQQFTPSHKTEPSWSLSLRKSDATSEYVSIYLNMKSSTEAQVRGKFKVSLLDKEGKEVKSKWHPTCNFESCIPVGFEKFLKKSCLYSLINDDKLKILCEVNYMINQFDFPALKKMRQQKEPEHELCRNFRNLLEKQQLYDITIAVQGIEFRAHKCLLAARSAVFAAMFEHDMNEKKNNYVVLEEIRPEIFKELLHFIYTDNVPNLKENAADLLAAADFYALEKLKRLCEQALSDNLSLETAIETLMAADQHAAEFLKTRTINFINRHAAAIIKTEDWKNMRDSRNNLITEILEALLKQRSKCCKGCEKSWPKLGN